MDSVWASGRPVPGREVLEDLAAHRRLAYTTVMTVLDRLTRKGLLRRELEGRAFVYAAVLSREEHTAELMAEALENADDRSAALVHFVDYIDSAEADAIRRALTRAQRARRRK